MNQTECAVGAAASGAAVAIDDLPLPYLEVNSRGVITRANRATLALHHVQQGELIGQTAWDLVAFDEKDLSHAAFHALMQSGGDPPVITRNIFDRSGSFRTYQLHRSLIRDAQGAPAGMRMVGVDVTESSHALLEARRAVQWFESAMASLTEAVILTDALGVICSANPAAELLSGIALSELCGMAIEEALPLVRHQSPDEAPLDHRTTIARNWKGAATVLNRRREEVRVEISTSPIIDQAGGSVVGVVAILRQAAEWCEAISSSPPASRR